MIDTYITTAVIDIIALILLFGLLHGNNIMADYRKKPFSVGIVLTVFVIIAEAGTIFADSGGTGLRSLNILFNILGFALAPLIPVILITIFDVKILKSHIIMFLPSLLNILASILSPIFRLYFYIDANNQYERGDIFFVFIAIYITNLLLLFSTTVRIGKKHFHPIKWKIFGLLIFTVAGTFIQLLFPTIYSSWHSVTLSLIMFYILLTEFDGSFDTLTGLYNRAAFEKAAKSLQDGENNSIIVMDINSFKEINDTYGHDYGDIVLKKVALIIRHSFDNRCSCYRIGGDEFYVLCRNSNQEKIIHQLRNMTANLASERLNDKCLPTVAYGFSNYQVSNYDDFSKALKAADDQMYQFKQLQKKY